MFVAESNRIEGIHRAPVEQEVLAHEHFLTLETVTVADLESFVAKVAGRAAVLRREPGLNVRVGPHLPPPGGPKIEPALKAILANANTCEPPYDVHIEYESLHPFLDGNGRSGRVLWAWMLRREGRDPFMLGFLHSWYYDSLDAGRV